METPLIKRPIRYSYYNAAFGIIIINVLFFILNYIEPRSQVYLSLVPGLIVRDRFYWQFITYMFMHAGIRHILYNMIGLFFFGMQVERRMGSTEFLIFYLVSGIGAGFFSFIVYILTGTYQVVLLGASGAVFAVLLAFGAYYPGSTIYLFGIIPIKTPILILFYVGLSLFNIVAGTSNGVAHLTHLAGFGMAFFYFLLRFNINPIRELFSALRGR
jgi:membrane associated rhomboid family serine protease